MKPGTRVYYHREKLWGTVLDKPADIDRIWVRFDYLPERYGTPTNTDCHTLKTSLITEDVFHSPLYKLMKELE